MLCACVYRVRASWIGQLVTVACPRGPPVLHRSRDARATYLPARCGGGGSRRGAPATHGGSGRGERGSRVALGRTEAGRYLRVVYVPDRMPDSLFVLTAYELGPKALRALRRRRR